MTDETTRTNVAGDSEHPASNLDTIVVDPDDIIEMMRRNRRDDDKRRSHSLRISPPFEGEIQAKPHVTEEGNYYPPEMDPTPIHLGDSTFLAGHSHPSHPEFPDEARYPVMNESRSLFRSEFEIEGEFTEAQEEQWEEWWSTELDFWEENVRENLHETTTLKQVRGDPSPSTTVNIRYENTE